MYILIKETKTTANLGATTILSTQVYHSRFKFAVQMKMKNDCEKLIKFLKKRSDWTENGKTLRHSRIDDNSAAVFYFENSIKKYDRDYRFTSTIFKIYKSRELILKDPETVLVK